jgi:hypothetical protein
MKLLQFSIARLMTIVGIVGLNLAFTQLWSHSSEPALLTGRFVTCIALQIGLFCLIRSRRSRAFAFWIGFEGFGLAAAITSIYIDFFYLFHDGDSRLANINDLYILNMYNLLSQFCRVISDPYWRGVALVKLSSHDGGFTDNMLFELVSSIPQIFMALIGGLLMALLRNVTARPTAASVPIGIL